MRNKVVKLGRQVARTLDPLTAGLQDVLEGPNHTFFVPATSGWSGLEIERLLARYGVRIWGRQIVKGEIMLTVREPQARWAQYLLDRNGVPLVGGTAYAAAQRSPLVGMPFGRRVALLFSHGLRELLNDLGV
jgi:hypothetical protein